MAFCLRVNGLNLHISKCQALWNVELRHLITKCLESVAPWLYLVQK